MQLPAIAISLLLIIQAPSTPLEQFQHEAESAIHKPISITESTDLGMAAGQSFCETNPVQIKILKTLDQETKNEALAHELGHVYLCGQGLLIYTLTTQTAIEKGLGGVVSSLGGGIQSCYVDPLVDLEMNKRGFNSEKLAQAIVRKVNSHTKQQIHDWVSRGDLYVDASAVAIYCTELLYSSVPVGRFESVFKDEPSVIAKVKMLRHDLGKPTCTDTASCIPTIKKLREEFDLKSYLAIWNPDTKQWE